MAGVQKKSKNLKMVQFSVLGVFFFFFLAPSDRNQPSLKENSPYFRGGIWQTQALSPYVGSLGSHRFQRFRALAQLTEDFFSRRPEIGTRTKIWLHQVHDYFAVL